MTFSLDVRKFTPRVFVLLGRAPKTLTRDLNALKKSGLVDWSPEGVRARKERMDAFMVKRRPMEIA